MIGQINALKIIKEVDFGLYLDGKILGEILLPLRYLPKAYNVGDYIDVFLYHDSEDRIIATTETPYAMVGECAYLKCIATNKAGAFLNWGLMKDLLVPFNQQKPPMEEGKSYIVYLYMDDQSGRIAASAKLDSFLFQDSDEDFKLGEEVSLLNANKTDLGYKVIINHTHWGLLHEQRVSRPLKRGERFNGFIKHVRDDGKIDICMHLNTREKLDDTAERILQQLQQHDDFLPLTDKSSSEAIFDRLNISKGLFKKTIGTLYKKNLIRLEPDGIYLNTDKAITATQSSTSASKQTKTPRNIPKHVWGKAKHD
ncbi:MAG: S1-like domain-containing RNA-binding protein [Mariprofundaceae bacterium]|nr:S1-like domain-containing RNA-binding protein [Mariprofundaceae bacterium]